MEIKKPYEVIKFDKLNGKLELPRIVLKNRALEDIGIIPKYDNWNCSLVGNGLDEITFDVVKYIGIDDNGKDIQCPVWDELIDLKIVAVDGYGCFEISVDYTDNSKTIKSIHGVSLETELGQLNLYDFHVNDDEDTTSFELDKDGNKIYNHIPTTFYNENDKTHSLLHRVLADKAPHWSWGYVTPYIALDEESKPELSSTFQRTYSEDGTSIYDFLTGTVAEESNVIFVFDTFHRIINVYNLCDAIDQETGETLVSSIGEDTTVFISKEKLANEITISSNKDSVKNCFRIEGGDDVITDLIRAVNMNGSNYIYNFADFQYNDMPAQLVSKIKNYQNMISSPDIQNEYNGTGKSEEFFKGNISITTSNEVEMGMLLCLCSDNDIETDEFSISDYNIYTSWVIVDNKLSGSTNSGIAAKTFFEEFGIFTYLCLLYSLSYYFESSMMPNVSLTETTAKEQYDIMVNELTKPGAVIGVSALNKYDNNLFVGITNNIEAMAKILVDSRYEIDIIEGSTSYNDSTHIWTGNILVSRTSDETDYYPNTQESINKYIQVKITEDEETYLQQKIDKALSSSSMSDIDFDVAEMTSDEMRKYFNKYSLNRLKSFADGYNSCISELIKMDNDSDVRNELYDKYLIRLKTLTNPTPSDNFLKLGLLEIRQAQVDNINSSIEATTKKQTEFQNKWNFIHGDYGLGEDLYKQLCAYFREDTYQNSNYISDGYETNTTKLLNVCRELFDVANKEIKKSCVLQRTISCSLSNLFALPEFETLYDKFALYNYIRIRTEDEIIKLRLIGADFSGDKLSEINVTFSDQIETVDGKILDTQSILQQASAIASSYTSTILQAKQGAEANSNFAEMYAKGLNAAKTMLTNNEHNEVTITPSGIICRRMDDEGYYGNMQLRITGNIMAFTTDDWQTVKMAIGETVFTNPITKETKKEYGIIAPNIVGKLIAGENMYIGNEKGNVLITGDGLSIYKGNIQDSNRVFYADNEGNLNVKGNIEADNGYFRGAIDGGYLYIEDKRFNNNTGVSVEINPNGTSFNGHNSSYVFSIMKNKDIIMGVDNYGAGTFKGNVMANRFELYKDNKIYGQLDMGKDAGENRYGLGIIVETNNKIDELDNGTSRRISFGIHVSDTIGIYEQINFTKDISTNEWSSEHIFMDTATFNEPATFNHIATFNNGINFASNLYLTRTSDNQYLLCHGRFGVGVAYDGFIFSVEGKSYIHGELTVSNNFKCETHIYSSGNIYSSGLRIGDDNIARHNVAYNTLNGGVKISMTCAGQDSSVYLSDNYNFKYLGQQTGIGTSSNIWGTSYISKVNNTSDKRLKKDISVIDERYEKFFMNLQPSIYKFIDTPVANHDRVHIGFVAQEVEDALKDAGLTAMDFAGFNYDKINEEELSDDTPNMGLDDIYTLTYTEFIALNTHMIQELLIKTSKLEERIKELEEKYNE